MQQQGRDNARTPIQWSDAPHGGFTESTPWLTINPNYTEINAKEALANPNSIFYFYQKMLAYRKEHSTLIYGDYQLLAAESEKVYAYRRWDEDGDFLVLLNFSDDVLTSSQFVNTDNYQLIHSNYTQRSIFLRPWEARIYRL